MTEDFLVLSWSNDTINEFHLNPRDSSDVIQLMEDRGHWSYRPAITKNFKEAATIQWIKDNVLVFMKKIA